MIGTRNLDMGIVIDANDEDQLNVVAPTQERTALAVLARTEDGVDLVGQVDLGSQAVTNIAVQELADSTKLAVGTDGNYLRIWG